MNKLDALLSIVERKERQQALLEYAKAFKIDSTQVRDTVGNINEEKLAVLIFDAQKARLTSRNSNSRFTGIALVVTAILMMAIIFLPKWLAEVYEKDEMTAQSQGKVMQAFDKDGNPVVENNQPVLYKLMDGVFHDYYEDGTVKYEYTYKEGQLMERKSYDRNGKLTDMQKSNPE